MAVNTEYLNFNQSRPPKAIKEAESEAAKPKKKKDLTAEETKKKEMEKKVARI